MILRKELTMITKDYENFVYADGGRELSGFKGKAGDCGARALSIATAYHKNSFVDYTHSYKLLAQANKDFGFAKSARNGVEKTVFHSVINKLGWDWYPAPKFQGRKAKCKDLPKGCFIAQQAGHYVAVIDGVPWDIFDSSQKMVYGYWKKNWCFTWEKKQ